jgi:hypothetical protein
MFIVSIIFLINVFFSLPLALVLSLIVISLSFQAIQISDKRLNGIRDVLIDCLHTERFDPAKCSFFLRFKAFFLTFHSKIYDEPFKCRSFIISFSSTGSLDVNYGFVHLFVENESFRLALIQRLDHCPSQLSSFLDIPSEIESKLHELFPLVSLSNQYFLVPVSSLRNKCTLVPFQERFCVSELRNDFEHD